MTTTWVLIFVVVTKVFGSYSVVQEFQTERDCLYELNKLLEFQKFTVKQEPHNAYRHTRCAPNFSVPR
jgi:hypothetical protein